MEPPNKRARFDEADMPSGFNKKVMLNDQG